jgi:hypothetical protein
LFPKEIPMKKATQALVAAALLASATAASATPSTVYWTPATTYTQPYLVPHLTYDTYFAEGGQLQPDYGLTIGLLPFDKVQAEVGIDLLVPGLHKDNFYLNGKVTLVEGAFAEWQPGVSFGIQGVGFKTDYSNYNDLYLTLGKTFGIGTIGVGGYYGAGSKLLYTSSAGKVERSGFMASYVSPDINVKLTGLDKIVFAADYASGKNYYGAYGVGVALYFTPAISLLTGPVFVNDKDLFKGTYGSSFYWTAQIDVDFDLRKPAPAAK